MTNKTLGFIGLGRMGLPMAENLLSAGFSLRVYNRTPEKAEPLVAKGATPAKSPADAAIAGGVIITMLADDPALLDLAGEDFCRSLGNGLHLSMSTVSPVTNKTLAERHAHHGGVVVAAPVFGRPEAAAAKKLWICPSGPAAGKERAKPIFDAVGQGVFDFGEEIGAGNVVKLAGNFLLTAAIEAMAEASAMAEKNGVPRAALLNMLTSTLFNCPIYNLYATGIINSEFETPKFAVPLVLKDMLLVQQTAAAGRAPMPIVNLLCDRYLSLIATGREKWDSTALALGASEDAGLKW